jgi:hypothetical protein
MKKAIPVEIDPDTFLALAQLGDPQRVLEWLAHCAWEGVRRPGSWERQWLHQCMGDEWPVDFLVKAEKREPASGYPADWPKCPGCDGPAMAGHMTCGERDCDEQGRRR